MYSTNESLNSCSDINCGSSKTVGLGVLYFCDDHYYDATISCHVVSCNVNIIMINPMRKLSSGEFYIPDYVYCKEHALKFDTTFQVMIKRFNFSS